MTWQVGVIVTSVPGAETNGIIKGLRRPIAALEMCTKDQQPSRCAGSHSLRVNAAKPGMVLPRSANEPYQMVTLLDDGDNLSSTLF